MEIMLIHSFLKFFTPWDPRVPPWDPRGGPGIPRGALGSLGGALGSLGGPWTHGPMDPWAHGPMGHGPQYHSQHQIFASHHEQNYKQK